MLSSAFRLRVHELVVWSFVLVVVPSNSSVKRQKTP